MSQSSSLLLGLDGITVEPVEMAGDRIRTVPCPDGRRPGGYVPWARDPVVAVQGLGGHPPT
ncbi:hypothetical protein MML61_09335 [Mycobacterium marinum]|nr:hypothetical protein VIMS_05242 [Mycobacterium marinum]WCS19986.1 hypothetical protein MML61_09335 [Mycobacterium marinum]